MLDRDLGTGGPAAYMGTAGGPWWWYWLSKLAGDEGVGSGPCCWCSGCVLAAADGSLSVPRGALAPCRMCASTSLLLLLCG
jgi:hypothetical protein